MALLRQLFGLIADALPTSLRSLEYLRLHLEGASLLHTQDFPVIADRTDLIGRLSHLEIPGQKPG